jgi:hypothetical protein
VNKLTLKLRNSLAAGVAILLVSGFSVFGQIDEIELNRRPLRDFANKFKVDIESKKIDLSAPFLVELQGKLDLRGRLDSASSSFTKSEGDTSLTNLVKEAILAISDAGYLQFLSSVGDKNIKLVVEQNSSQFSADFFSGLESPARAKTITSALNLMLAIAKAKKQAPEATEEDKKDLFLVNGFEVFSEEANIRIAFKVPSERFRALILEEVSQQVQIGK